MGKNGIEPALEVEKLEKVFGTFTAVDGVSFAVEKGEVFALIGPNGAGKSTIIKMLTTLLPPTSGMARVAGHDVVKQPTEVRKSIGYIPQLVSSDGALTARENLLLSARLYGVPRAEQEGRIREALDFMGLGQFSDRLVSSYSGGMIRRLEIAQSMLHRPSVIFMDEPTVGLDPVARKAVWDHVRELKEKYRMTIILTTHYMDEVEELCDRMALIQHGRIVAIDTPHRLKEGVGEGATLDDVFAKYMSSFEENSEGGNYSEVRRNRSSVASRG
ncbi:MAG: ATP-binding cassette domain-containing protein [Thermodesulfobacteriota bacterium]